MITYYTIEEYVFRRHKTTGNILEQGWQTVAHCDDIDSFCDVMNELGFEYHITGWKPHPSRVMRVTEHTMKTICQNAKPADAVVVLFGDEEAA